ncbi:hypothetical protein MJT46_017388 [Ovis ammon polii x Ovis aries]|nr:hypothetical protein MJT46_017388 [Ovis ammon polii x Ovis aries]
MRDTASTALEESASACPHSRRGLTPLGRLQKYPKIHVSTGEESSGSGPDSTQGLRPRHRRERNPERPPRNSHGDWPFLRPPERVPEVPVKYPKIHVSTGEESSGSSPDSTQGLRPRHRRERNPERPPRNSHGDWPFLRPPERVPEGPVESREEVKRRATIPRVPLMSQSIPEDLFSLCCLYFHDEDRLRPQRHVAQLCTKSSCESLEGNPRGKATDPMIDAMASVTLLPQLGRKANVHVPSQEED